MRNNLYEINFYWLILYLILRITNKEKLHVLFWNDGFFLMKQKKVHRRICLTKLWDEQTILKSLDINDVIEALHPYDLNLLKAI